MAAPAPPPPPQLRLFATEAQRRNQIQVINGSGPRLSDLYYVLIRAQWRSVFAFVTGCYLALNAIFGLGYWGLGGVQGTDGGFLDHFFFSVQTFGTIGYGAMYPLSKATQSLVVLESVCSLLLSATVTGLVFAKFARPTARVLWSKTRGGVRSRRRAHPDVPHGQRAAQPRGGGDAARGGGARRAHQGRRVDSPGGGPAAAFATTAPPSSSPGRRCT